MQLSIIVAAYNMSREIPRTLTSMLPPAQQGVENVDYEIIVVDNGSTDDLDLSGFEHAARPVRLVRHAPGEALVTPVNAINDAVRDAARGDQLLVCIDGARMLSKCLIRRSLDVLAKDRDAVAFVPSFHLGEMLQKLAMEHGYNQEVEDRLLAGVDWQNDLDTLFGISVFAGCHHPQSHFRQNESNALCMTRESWDALGGFNEGFVRPGGGLCNLELFTRIVERPDALSVCLLGEGTFHQFHGGAATANPAYFKDSLDEYKTATGREYEYPQSTYLTDLGLSYGRAGVLGVWGLGAVDKKPS